ncbi:MAG: imidazole glycerol phosphate synthase subunit HisH [Nitrospirales bacterium]|nr:imidazole glycerol phosphate synthase subunit HisH [Nitrospirales bacterium]
MGNLRSVQKAFETVGHPAVLTRDPQVIDQASHVVLPGVGAFGDCMANLERFGLIDPIHKAVQQGKPFLGICLGMQLLFTESEEFGPHQGLNLIPGKVKRFPNFSVDTPALKIPHMGWNTITVQNPSSVLQGIESETHMYFVHSYYVEPTDPDVSCTTTDYGIPFTSSIVKENIFASQFHPEKSQRLGLQLLRNFGAWQ